MTKQEIINYMYENHVQGDFKIEEMAEDLSQKTGKWVLDNPRSDDSLIYRYACSECHAHHRARYDFCPSCGADMRGDEKMNKDIIGKSFREWEERDTKKLDVGGRIAKILCERKMTQRELAQKCHITEVSMSRYINNDRMPKGTVIVAVAKALGVSADYLLGLSELRGEHDESIFTT